MPRSELRRDADAARLRHLPGNAFGKHRAPIAPRDAVAEDMVGVLREHRLNEGLQDESLEFLVRRLRLVGWRS